MKPSLDLLHFISQFQDLCSELDERFKDIEGNSLFTAYIRNGCDTVFNTFDQSTWGIFQVKNPYARIEEFDEDWDPLASMKAMSGRPSYERFVVTEADRPGRWVVASLCIKNWRRGGLVTLYSSDFLITKKGRPRKAEIVMSEIIEHLQRMSHTIPRAS